MAHDERKRPKAQRPTRPKYLDGPAIEDDDSMTGAWPEQDLLRMNREFAKALAAAVRKGQ